MRLDRLKVKYALGAVAAVIATLLVLVALQPKRRASLRVLFPVMTVFKENAFSLNPKNLETVSEYYLAENLGVGLLRDDTDSPGGYGAALAISWRRVDARTWAFELRPELRWSDGSKLDHEEIRSQIDNLRASNSRHLRLLHSIDAVHLHGSSLVLRFKQEASDWLLHELSLADAAIYHPRNLAGDWSVTSGPYSLGQYDGPNFSIILKRNVHSVLAHRNEMQDIRLFWPSDREQLTKAFKGLEVDLFFTVSQVFSRRQQIMIKNAPQLYRGVPHSLAFYRFNPDSKFFTSTEHRQAFRKLVQETVHDWTFSRYVNSAEQFIPVGFSGRVGSIRSHSTGNLDDLRGKRIILRHHPQMQEATGFEDRLISAAAKVGAEISIIHRDASGFEQANEEMAALTTFKGNQRDALGTWSFLFSRDGAFSHFEPEVAQQLDMISHELDEARRERLLQSLHLQALEKAYGVPVYFEESAALAANDLDLRRLNRFDLRPRFYEIGIKR